MAGFRKRQLATAVLALWLAAPALAQDEAKLDALFAELARPGNEDWERVETEITRIWSKSGSPAMDLLLKRGQDALEAEDYPTAVEHFSALIDHAPDFAEGWNRRATLYFLQGRFDASLADIDAVLALEPRHFGALSGQGLCFLAKENLEAAAQSFKHALEVNPQMEGARANLDALKQILGDDI